MCDQTELNFTNGKKYIVKLEGISKLFCLHYQEFDYQILSEFIKNLENFKQFLNNKFTKEVNDILYNNFRYYTKEEICKTYCLKANFYRFDEWMWNIVGCFDNIIKIKDNFYDFDYANRLLKIFNVNSLHELKNIDSIIYCFFFLNFKNVDKNYEKFRHPSLPRYFDDCDVLDDISKFIKNRDVESAIEKIKGIGKRIKNIENDFDYSNSHYLDINESKYNDCVDFDNYYFTIDKIIDMLNSDLIDIDNGNCCYLNNKKNKFKQNFDDLMITFDEEIKNNICSYDDIVLTYCLVDSLLERIHQNRLIGYIYRNGNINNYEVKEFLNNKILIMEDLKKVLLQLKSRYKKERKIIDNLKNMTLDVDVDWDSLTSLALDDEQTKATSIEDGLSLCILNKGYVDIPYISAITGVKDPKVIIDTLRGSIYQNPLKMSNELFYEGRETSEEYLSGNISKKLQIAKQYNDKYNGYFISNIKALESVLPTKINPDDIYITLGSPWIPEEIIKDFILECYNEKEYFHSSDVVVTHDKLTGKWNIDVSAYLKNWIKAKDKYEIRDKMSGLTLIKKTLNSNNILIYKDSNKVDKNGKPIRILDEEKTIIASEKREQLIEDFKKWAFEDKGRKAILVNIFEEKYCQNVKRVFNGDYLKFKNMNPVVNLYSYQKNAIARILFSKNVLLAHDVGAGKTFVMIAAGQELKRLKVSMKNMYVVPNNIVRQWYDNFKYLYEDSNVLCITPKDFTPKNKYLTMLKIKDNDYDGIIIPYSCFESIPTSKEYYDSEEGKRIINEFISNSLNIDVDSLPNLNESISEAKNMSDNAKIVFEDFKINRLFVDEAHNFKNVPFKTSLSNPGINPKGSPKCQDMLDKVRIIQKNNDGGGVIFATGTPITNSITDAYIMQYYLQQGELELKYLNTFDAWVKMYAESKNVFEVDVDTNNYKIRNRFIKFHNLNQLTMSLSNICDFHSVDVNDGIPLVEYEIDEIKKSDDLKKYLLSISNRADKLKIGSVDPKDDNYLKITIDGRKAALDVRLVNNKSIFSKESKVYECAKNVAYIYKEYMDNKSTQLIFCDVSTPKKEFNIYDELKRLLIKNGVKDEEIAYVHSAKNEKELEKLFKNVREGVVRVLIGSTFKVGIGVNVQDKLIALHHIDVPWRPSDMTQREGRILRQGNTNKEVKIYRYITKDSFDAYSWQLLETKQKIISDILSGSLTKNTSDDIEDTVLKYGEVKALAIGNPDIKKKVELTNELNRLSILERKYEEEYEYNNIELQQLPIKIQEHLNLCECIKKDKAYYSEYCSIEKKNNKTNEEIAEFRKDFKEKLQNKLNFNILKDKDEHFDYYKGFEIILPANMVKDYKFVYIKSSNKNSAIKNLGSEYKYKLDLGESSTGNLSRIDNFLEGFEDKIKKEEESIDKLKSKIDLIKQQLSTKNSYKDEIECLIKEIAAIDKKLGIII